MLRASKENLVPQDFIDYYQGKPLLVDTLTATKEGGIVYDVESIELPEGYAEDITPETHRQTAKEFGGNFRIDSTTAGYRFEGTHAQKGKDIKWAILHSGTFNSTLSNNKGQIHEAGNRFILSTKLFKRIIKDVKRLTGIELDEEQEPVKKSIEYRGNSATGANSSIKSKADRQQLTREGRTTFDATETEPARVLEYIDNFATVVHKRSQEDGKANIAYGTADDAFALMQLLGTASALTDRDHEIKGLVMGRPPEIYKRESLLSIKGLQRAVRMVRSMQEEPNWQRDTPDPHWYDPSKWKERTEEWFTDGYEEKNGTRQLPKGTGQNLLAFPGKTWLLYRYLKHQRANAGEGMIRDIDVLLEKNSDINFTFIIPLKENDPEYTRKRKFMERFIGKIAMKQSSDAYTKVYFVHGAPRKYPEQFLRGLWEGILHKAIYDGEMAKARRSA
jgi:hypothetical protein